MSEMKGKIVLPEHCNPLTGNWYKKPKIENCEHDFERDTEWNDDYCYHWKCSKCDGIYCYEVYD